MLKFVQTHGMGSDCTAPYDVELDKPYTVAEFINEVLATRKNEWGTIEVKGAFSLKYRYGKTEQEIPEQYANLPVKKAHASGGWSAMDYYLKVEAIRSPWLPKQINERLFARILETGEIVKVHGSVTIQFNERDQNGNWRLPPDELELREPKEEGFPWRARILQTGEVIDIRMEKPIFQYMDADERDKFKDLSKYKLEEIEFFYSDMDEKDMSPFEPNREKGKHETVKEIDWEQRRYEIAKDCFVREFNRIAEKIDKVIEDRSDVEAENIVNSTIKRLIKGCVGVADDLIKELKGEE